MAGLPPEFRVDVDDAGDRVVVAVHGELDIATASDLEAAVRDPVAAGRHVVIDLRGLGFIDSSGVRVLITTRADAEEHGGRLSLVPGPGTGPVGQVLTVSGLTGVFALLDDPGA